MNIFIYDNDFETNAQYHCDKHVVKMITESNQILSAVHWLSGNEAPYKLTHQSHPCTLWAMQSKSNYEFLIELCMNLCIEYTYRYGRIHKGEGVLFQISEIDIDLPDIGLTDFALAMPEQYRCKDPVKSYRDYFNGDKQHIASWKNRPTPEWFREAV